MVGDTLLLSREPSVHAVGRAEEGSTDVDVCHSVEGAACMSGDYEVCNVQRDIDAVHLCGTRPQFLGSDLSVVTSIHRAEAVSCRPSLLHLVNKCLLRRLCIQLLLPCPSCCRHPEYSESERDSHSWTSARSSLSIL
eukprot:m.226453 g.226453  ORF g.226453 m.226453 type:complete len:137 (+) comp25929_c0_seq4:1484-1894(+)